MKKLFDALVADNCFQKKCEDNHILNAVFYALRSFVDEGGDLKSLPWFSLTKFANKDISC